MSVNVDVSQLQFQIETYGSTPFLVTTSDDQRPHLTHVVVTLDECVLRCQVGRKSATNASSRPQVSLLWPAVDEFGFSLIVDGVATVEPGDSPRLSIAAQKAVLHRNALGDGYKADCAAIDGTPI